jgi:DNA mismatch endonuclease (patch repair protein)
MKARKTEIRSKIMRSIRSKNTKPEVFLRKYLYSLGFRYRINDKKLPGTPDIVLKKYSTVIFMHGCFWHGHDCSIGSAKRRPKTNTIYWDKKIKHNIIRDELTLNTLEKMGWNVIVIWECELSDKNIIDRKINSLISKKQLYKHIIIILT